MKFRGIGNFSETLNSGYNMSVRRFLRSLCMMIAQLKSDPIICLEQNVISGHFSDLDWMSLSELHQAEKGL